MLTLNQLQELKNDLLVDRDLLHDKFIDIHTHSSGII